MVRFVSSPGVWVTGRVTPRRFEAGWLIATLEALRHPRTQKERRSTKERTPLSGRPLFV